MQHLHVTHARAGIYRMQLCMVCDCACASACQCGFMHRLLPSAPAMPGDAQPSSQPPTLRQSAAPLRSNTPSGALCSSCRNLRVSVPSELSYRPPDMAWLEGEPARHGRRRGAISHPAPCTLQARFPELGSAGSRRTAKLLLCNAVLALPWSPSARRFGGPVLPNIEPLIKLLLLILLRVAVATLQSSRKLVHLPKSQVRSFQCPGSRYFLSTNLA